MPRNPDISCADCGRGMWSCYGRSLPQGQATCRPCRDKRPKCDRRTPCEDCGTPSTGIRCRPCATKARPSQRLRPDDDPRVRRYDREKSAPGLTRGQRDALMRTWRSQGRTCAYCPSPATTLDHVVPLVRGGTNYEGNLTPCCKRCNSSKAGWLLSEWRHDRKPSHVTGPGITWPMKPGRKPKAKVWVDQALSECPICHALHTGGRVYCSKACGIEANNVKARNRYREIAGIPLDAPVRGYQPRFFQKTSA